LSALSIYERFETFVAFVLTFVIGAVVVVALYRLVAGVVQTLVLDSLNLLTTPLSRESSGRS
jgi:hypothetical protein